MAPREITFGILTTTTTGQDDGSPLQYVSAAQLSRYRAAESELAELKATDAVKLMIRLRRWLAWLLIV